ncbi:MAG: hypothetical protein CME43_06565 [Haliea sp.]|uniref:hypothetical protein n=1 Tax=Haliea sp. TaxID=1932666 RepID=UPI000C6C0FBB|nr:hypothetical protein [Haliea sp.]MBM69125.1 hypothetical protein [Haliea sp.]|tara:strand:- start:86 stop:430 length:345 start_codon:yes stop_codon:yes gene_type:complete
MTALRVLLVAVFIVLTAYTGIVIGEHGFGLLSVFFGDMARMGWAGQFNLDFMFMLTLSALWVSWRHGFSVAGLCLGVAAFFGGALFLSLYLLIQSFRVNGQISALLVGPDRMRP